MFSIGQIVALARDASMSTSYKPALLKALVRVVPNVTGSTISLETLGAEYLRLYWIQTVVFRLRQAATLTKEPEIPRDIRDVAERYQARDFRQLSPDVRKTLEARLARRLKTNVLAAFHKSKPPSMPHLFTWSGADSIDVSEESRKFIVEHKAVLEAVANLWWARYLEKVNLLAPLIIQKVERNGAMRKSLSGYLRLLRDTDGTSCFYCNCEFDHVTVHVDHVIPWSFMLSDPLWDLVLACERCNRSKADRLPQRGYLHKLQALHVRRAKIILPPKVTSPFLHIDDVNRFYDAAVSVEWPANWSPQP